MSNLNALHAERTRIITPDSPKPIVVAMERPLWRWVQTAATVRPHSLDEILNTAVGFAALGQLAGARRASIGIQGPTAALHKLPTLGTPFNPGGLPVEELSVDLTEANRRLLGDMGDRRGLSAEMVVRDGVCILGAMARVAARAQLVMQDGMRLEVYGFNATGLPIFPKEYLENIPD